MALAGEEHGRDFYAVLMLLWVEKDRYRPELWLEEWQQNERGGRSGR